MGMGTPKLTSANSRPSAPHRASVGGHGDARQLRPRRIAHDGGQRVLLNRYRQRAFAGVYVPLVPCVFAATKHLRLVDVLLELALGVNVLIWCLIDARIHGKVFQHAFVLPFLATWPISVAFHLVWTRGPRGLCHGALGRRRRAGGGGHSRKLLLDSTRPVGEGPSMRASSHRVRER